MTRHDFASAAPSMRVRRLGVLLLSTSTLVLGSVGTAGAADSAPFAASFDADPVAPVAGQQVLLRATSTGALPDAPLSHEWDLDGDGAFDDAAGDTAQATFQTVGAHTVSVRASRPLDGVVQTRTASRVFTVTAASPPEAPEPPADPTPDPLPPTPPEPPAAAPNQPPAVAFDRQCSGSGFARLCVGARARQGETKRVSAAPSTDPDGRIVRYEWSLDGDLDIFEVDSGAVPYVDHVFEPGRLRIGVDNRLKRVAVRVTDDRGATAVGSFQLRIVEASCRTSVPLAGGFIATGDCLRPANAARSVRWMSKEAVSLNGILLRPRGGEAIVVEVPRAGAGAAPEVRSRDAVVSMAASGVPATLSSGRVAWKVAGGELLGFALGGDAQINGMRMTRLAGPVKLAGGRAQARATLALPAAFGAPTSKEPVVLGGLAASVAASGRALSFEVPSAALGPIGLDRLKVTFDGEDLWVISAAVVLPPPAAIRIDGEAGVRSSGAFDHAYAEMAFQNGGIAIGGPIPLFLQRIRFAIEMNPKRSACVPATGVQEVYWPAFLGPRPASVPATVDHGHPTFALCGEIGLSGGPTVAGKAAVRLNAGLGWATYADRPWVLRAHGDMFLAEIPLAQARLAVYGDGYITATGRFRWGIPSVASIRGGLSAQIYKSRFNATAYVDACLDFADWCAGARAIVSSKGIAACLKIDVLVGDWTPGIGYMWGDSFPDLYFQGCSVGRYRVQIDRAQARAAGADAPRTVQVPAGLQGTVMVFEGADAPPKIELTGPGGERIVSPADGRPTLEERGHVLIEDPRTNMTHVLISRPSTGAWRASTTAGSSPIVQVRTADGLPQPQVRATVARDGGERVLRYRVAPLAGQRVTFVERGETAGGAIGAAAGRAGTLRFTPADGAAERRRVVALVEQDGRLRAELDVATFAAPKASKPARVRRLRIARAGSRALVGWQRVRGATYRVQARTADGRTLVHTAARPALSIGRVPRRGRVRVTVRAISSSGLVGAPATTTLDSASRQRRH